LSDSEFDIVQSTCEFSAQNGRLIRFEDAALELCGRRVSAESGDVRKALQACRQAALNSSTADNETNVIGVVAMARKLSELLAGQGAQRHSCVSALPLHQQLVLCTLARNTAGGRFALSLAGLCAEYSRLCRRHGLSPVAGSEVVGVVEGLIDAGLVGRLRGAIAVTVPLPNLTAALEAAAPLIGLILAAPQ
jgi:Cdc6-like AAA superfamily ATPase